MINATLETIYMLLVSMIIACLLGIPLGISLIVTKKNGLKENLIYHKIVDIVLVNITRSIPFVILIVLLIPLSRLLVGRSYGTTAFLIPLSIGTVPFIARIIENSLNEVDKGLIEMGHSIGFGTIEIIYRIMIPEAMPSIISGLTLTLISLVSYTAIAGVIGGGGLGNMAVIEGYQRGEKGIMYQATLVIVILVQVIQFLGTRLVKKIEERREK